MKFNREFLESLDKDNIVSDIITDHDRWSVSHERVFKYKGKFYITHYSVGATEYQEQEMYYDDVVECKEVAPVQKLVTVYEVVK